jgi:hypothetical protein
MEKSRPEWKPVTTGTEMMATDAPTPVPWPPVEMELSRREWRNATMETPLTGMIA